jgi:hypothetical protein
LYSTAGTEVYVRTCGTGCKVTSDIGLIARAGEDLYVAAGTVCIGLIARAGEDLYMAAGTVCKVTSGIGLIARPGEDLYSTM